jgi:hypothetical protein
MDVNAEIVSIKAELVELKQQLLAATGEERIAIQYRITAKENQLTEYVKLLQTTSGTPFFFLFFHNYLTLANF